MVVFGGAESLVNGRRSAMSRPPPPVAVPPAPPLPPPPPPSSPHVPPGLSADVGSRAAQRRICLVGELGQQEEIVKAAESFGIPVLASDTGEDIAENTDIVTHFFLPEFEGPLFESLRKSSVHRVLGPTAILQLCKQNEAQLPDNVRPLYSLSMRSAFICFTGFRDKEELTHLITLIHHMGGSIRKDMSSKVTHLIANRSSGEKYRYATTFHVPMIERAWVERFWADRHVIDCQATDENLLNKYKVKVFLGLGVCFVGFSEEECQHMTEILIQNGGEVATLEDKTCSHVVVANDGMYNCTFPFDLFLQSSPKMSTPCIDEVQQNSKQKCLKRSASQLSDIHNFKNSDNLHESGFKNSNSFTDDHHGNISSKKSLFSENISSPSESPDLHKLFYPDDDNCDVTLPSMNNISPEDFKTYMKKKRPRTSVDSNFEIDVKKENTWKSPFKKLKLKDSFKYKAGDNFPLNFVLNSNKSTDVTNKLKDIKNDIDNCSVLTLSLEKDDLNTSIVSSSGIFNVSMCSLQQSKVAKSVSKLRRGMRSLTASFRSERKHKYEKRIPSNHNSPKLDKRKLEQDESVYDISPVSTTNFDVSSNNLTYIPELSETNAFESENKGIESPVIFKTPKNKKFVKKHRHTVYGPTLTDSFSVPPNQSTPINSMSNVGIKGSSHTLSHKLHPKTCNPEARPKTNVKTSLDCSILSVVDEHNTQALPEVASNIHIVRAEWFWISVQNEEAQDEKDYLFEDYLQSQISPSRCSSHDSLSSSASGPGGGSPPHTPNAINHTACENTHSSQRIRKRKLRGPESALNKRRSSVGDAVLLSLSANLLDCTQSPDGKQSVLDEVESITVSDAARKHMSPRQQVFMELVQTESNYVGILHTIVTMFKKPLEEMTYEDDPSKALLNNTEMKIIFGNLVPIYEIHRKMLEELKWSSHNWSEEISIGRIILKYAPDLVKAYPPFVNFFENMKDMLNQCDRDKPRFHAFLKGRQTKPECGRQTLQELMIRPVQRLGSINLLLDDILKHTNKSNPDHSALESAIVGLKEVMTYVNEDKRKTEGQRQMFDIYNEIDSCPAHLVSSHRSFVARCDVMELSKDLSGRGDNLVLFLFTDTMEVCKKKSKVFNSKSPPMNGIHHAASRLGSSKSYRHVQLMPLTTVKRVIDIRESEECHKAFALMCRSNQEFKEKLYSFTITDESIDKMCFLRQLCRQMANTVCKTDADKFLATLESHQLDIDTSDIALGTLSKAFKFASRTRLKVGRAFSFNKTPSKLKRAVSSMISPFGSTSNLTPASQLAQMRLASCNNINEIGVTNSGQTEVLVAPMSVQPTRKAKTASLSTGALRRL